MKLIINNLKMALDDELDTLKEAVSKKLKVNAKHFESFKIVKESIDARKKSNIHFVYSVVVEMEGKMDVPYGLDIRVLKEPEEEQLIPGNEKMEKRPIVIGSGPAGVFAGLVLAQNGYKPLILERGECVENRCNIVSAYWKTGVLDEETNVQFGEGGAGTFSDGKLTTRINDRRCDKVIQEFYRHGAHEEILYKAKPHIGSDVLRKVVVNMRKEIGQLGGEYQFNARCTSLKMANGRITGVVVNGEEEIEADVVVLAIGHSARDTFSQLYNQGIPFQRKPFSIGVRIEHPQELINRSQYGEAAGHPRLGAADYQLFHKTQGRTVYSFCMCPGGVVVASASEQGMIVTNGMSDFARDKENANSALVVSVNPEDFGSPHPLSGIEFQRKWERLAFEVGGGDNAAPIQTLGDFMKGATSGSIGKVKPSYTGKVKVADLHQCLPAFVTSPMKEAILPFDRKIKGFGMKDALLTGVETRTSSPVRIPRSDSLEALGVKGLYPSGEGAGYAGGIVSAAVDGIRVAEKIIQTFKQPT